MAHTDYQAELPEFTVDVGARGRFVLPAQVRHQLGIRQGDKLILTVAPGGIINLISRKGLAKTFRGVYKHLSAASSLAGELIADRRREANND